MATASAASQVASFIAKFDPANAKLIRACRTAMRKRLPTANELVYDNYNFLAIGYSASERAIGLRRLARGGSNGVALSFYYGATLPDPDGILLGSGNQNRFVRLPTAATLTSRRWSGSFAPRSRRRRRRCRRRDAAARS